MRANQKSNRRLSPSLGLFRPGAKPGVLFILWIVLCAWPARGQEPNGETEADLQFEFAERLFQLRVYKTAAAEYRSFLQDYAKDPRREGARYNLAMCYFRLGGEENARKALAELAILRKEFPNGNRIQDCLFRSGHIRYMLGDDEGAVADLTDLAKLKVKPGLEIPMHHFLGRAEHDLGRFPQARRHLEVVADAPRDNELRPYALMVLADTHLKLDDLGRSAAVLDKLLRDYPDLPTSDEMWLRLGDARLGLHEFAKALAAYEKVGAKGKWKHHAAIGRARVLLGLKKYPAAVELCKSVAANFRETPATKDLHIPEQCLYVGGVANFRQAKYARAVEAFTKLLAGLQQGPIAEDAAYKLCWCYYRQGPKLAKELVTTCVKFRRLFPASKWTKQVVFLAAEGYVSLGDYENAAAHYRQISEDDPNYGDALYRVAYCYHKQNKPEAAARAYDLFVEKFEKRTKAAAALAAAGGLYQAAERYEQAIARYKEYLAAAPPGPEAEEVAYQLGVCFAKMSQFDLMARAVEDYAKKYPQGAHAAAAFHWLGRRYRIQGDQRANHGDAAAAAAEYVRAQKAFQAGAAISGPGKDRMLLSLAQCFYNLARNRAARAAELASAANSAEGDRKRQLLAEAAELEKQSAASFRDAAEGFFDIIARKPAMLKDESACLWTGAYFREHKEPRAAVQVFKAFVKHFKSSNKADAALYQLALLHGELVPPDHGAVLEYCDRLLEHHPKSKFALQTKFAKAETLYRRGKLKPAEKLYLEVSRRGAGALKVGSVIKLGHICFKNQEYAVAVRYFGEIGLLYADQSFCPEALYFAGKSDTLLKDFNEATKFWQQLLKRYPDSTWAADARKELAPLGYIVAPDGTIKKK